MTWAYFGCSNCSLALNSDELVAAVGLNTSFYAEGTDYDLARAAVVDERRTLAQGWGCVRRVVAGQTRDYSMGTPWRSMARTCPSFTMYAST